MMKKSRQQRSQLLYGDPAKGVTCKERGNFPHWFACRGGMYVRIAEGSWNNT